ncbi:hypothetical protein QFC22_003215 [Naganishia vaughanmartiniae]|uniref:Uncharacterized protein n=1 Tax=Naganishia vaughanmartiniae TaxID=1424756 RepID=A0ACC2X9P6_9TREE|nr:hypothetical protein QFC22_003215 [Naganishia vaughanmartiniae]
MSSQSGLAIPATITTAFTTAVADPSTRALVFLIPDSTSYALHATLPVGTKPHPTAPKGASQAVSDVASLLPALPSAGTCASFLFKAEDADGGWIHISYIPDNAPTRQKMLHASSKSTLLKQLSSIHPIGTTLFFTSPGDLTPTGFDAALKSRDAPPPMTKSEEALRDIKAGEAAEAQERLERMFGSTSLSPPSTASSSSQQPGQATRAPSLGLKPQPHVFGAPQPIKQRSLDSSSPSSSSGGGLARGGVGAMGAILGGASGLGAGADKGSLKWAEGVEESLKGMLEGNEGKVVVLSIDPKSETIVLSSSSTSGSVCKPEELASRLPGKEPSYAFYAWPSITATSFTTEKTAQTPAPEKKNSLTVPGRQESLSPRPTAEGQDEANQAAAGENDDKEPKDIALPVSPMPTSPAGDAPPSPARAPSPTSTAQRKIAFVYACPSASPVRNRMLFSTCVRGLIRGAEERCGVKVSKKVKGKEKDANLFLLSVSSRCAQIETSDIAELSSSFLKAELFDSGTPMISIPRGSTPSFNNGNGNGNANTGGGGVDTSPGTGDAWNAFGPRVGRPKPAGRR